MKCRDCKDTGFKMVGKSWCWCNCDMGDEKKVRGVKRPEEK